MAGPYVSSNPNNYFGFGKQSAKGTGVVPTLFIPYIGAVSGDHGQEGDEVREGGSGLYVARARKTGHKPSGTGQMACRPSSAAKLIAWFLGGTDTVTGAGPYTHTVTGGGIANTWLSVERNLADELIDRFVDAQIRKIVLSSEGGGDLMINFEWAALTAAWQGSPTAELYEAADPFQADEATFTIDGSPVTDVERWEVALTWGLDENVQLHKVTRAQLPKLTLAAEVTTRQLIVNATDYRATNYGSASGSAPSKDYAAAGSFKAAFDDGAAGASNRQLSVELDSIIWREATFPISPDGETVYLERKGIMTKGTDSVELVAVTGDSSAY